MLCLGQIDVGGRQLSLSDSEYGDSLWGTTGTRVPSGGTKGTNLSPPTEETK
jgi:hypothetical protein